MSQPATAAPPAPPRRLLVASLLATIGYGLVAMTLCLPSLPSWSETFGVAHDAVQLTFSSFVIGFGGAQVIYGPLSDRHGRRRLLFVGLGLAVLGSLAAAAAQGLAWLVAARFVQGAGAAAGMVLGRAMVQDFFAAADRTRVMAYTGMVLGLCPPTATVIGGQVHVLAGWRANFVLAALLAVVLLAIAWRVVPADRPAKKASEHWLREFARAYAHLLRLPAFLAYCAILGMCTGAFYVFLAGLPVVLTDYGVGPAEIGWYVMFPPLCYIAGNFVCSRLLKRTSEMRIMFLGQFTTLVGISITLALAGLGANSALAVTAPLALLGLGHGLLMPSTLAGTVSLVPALAGAAAAGAGLAQQLFGAVGGYVVGLTDSPDAVHLGQLLFAFMTLSLLAQVVLYLTDAHARHGGG